MKMWDKRFESQMIHFGLRQLDALPENQDLMVFPQAFEKKIVLKHPDGLVPLDNIPMVFNPQSNISSWATNFSFRRWFSTKIQTLLLPHKSISNLAAWQG